jgi:putative membrane protein
LSGEWLWRVSGLSETLKYNLRALPGTIMKTLVLCVDRDDDLGTKAGMNGPVIGREENLKASVSLGLADPEEVDTNTILAGLQIYDDLMKRGMDAEIATIAGDTHVGFQSDLILTNQLENVLEVVKPDRAILVSDGAEDEAVYPVISSRVKVDFVKRVYVKQSRSIEGTYYMIIKTLQDEKIRRKWIMPVSLLLIIFGSLSLFTKVVQFSEGNFEDIALLSQMSPGIIGIVLGLYLVGWAYHWADRFQQRVVRTKRSIRQGSLAIPFTIVAMVLGLIGMMIGYDTANVYGESLLPGERSLAIMILKFVSGAVWFIVFGVFAYETGKSVTAFLRTGRIKWSFIVMMVSVLATGFIIQGAVDAMLFFVSSEVVEPIVIFAEMITGILIALFSSVLYASLRSEAVQQALAAEEGA